MRTIDANTLSVWLEPESNVIDLEAGGNRCAIS